MYFYTENRKTNKLQKNKCLYTFSKKNKNLLKKDDYELINTYRKLHKTKKGNSYEKHSKDNKINTNLNSRKLIMKF